MLSGHGRGGGTGLADPATAGAIFSPIKYPTLFTVICVLSTRKLDRPVHTSPASRYIPLAA